jgi:hypothetical protein
MYKSIYVPVDNSDHSNRAVACSVALGKAFSAKLVGCHVYAAKLHDYRFRQMEDAEATQISGWRYGPPYDFYDMAKDPEGLRAAWATLERTWAATIERVAAMPAGTVDVSVGGEWSFAQTLRHLILAIDMWLGRAILEIEQPFHPVGLADTGTADGAFDVSVFATDTPSYAEVLEARAGRVAMVRDFLDTVTSDELAAARKNPHAPEHQETTLACLHTILEEEWEHHRYAVRDLDAVAARSDA